MQSIDIQIENSNCLPQIMHLGDAGMDLKSNEKFILHPLQRKLVSTGIFINIPFGYVGYIMSRSGLATKNGVICLNAPGVIDHGYTGEIMVNLINLGSDIVEIEKENRIAQLIIQKIELPSLNVVNNIESTTTNNTRKNKGHGSSGL